MTQKNIPPAQLWVGSKDNLVSETEVFLQKRFCTNNGCLTCSTCRKIRQKNHHAIIWLTPEKQYSLADLDVIFNALAFKLEKNELFFIVLEKADLLSAACSNRLLKPLEEPLEGYHFLLLTEKIDPILPTIKSRCTTKIFASHGTPAIGHPLYKIFTHNFDNISPQSFLQLLDKSTPHERESLELADAIMHYWTKQQKNQLIAGQNTTKSESIINCLKKILDYPPMPGSSKIFWRNLFSNLTTL
ncbi:hypothetical protein HN446_04480 [bacterium]|jgi:DNA polymerase III gamma/tau subunit|nr:hypothetical protein [bacterium]